MKNKKQLTLLSVILATTMLLGACNPVAPKSSSNVPDTSSSSQEAVTLVSISVTAPTKTAYSTTDTALDLAGMVVTANYSNETSEVVSEGYTVSTVDFSTPGQKTVTVTYGGQTDTFTITVTAPVTLTSISVTAPTKVAYTTADTALDLAGMVVTAHYSDQTTQVVTTGYTVSQVDFSTVGSKTVTVTYEGKTATFTITVAAQKFTVRFVVNGVEVQSGEVEEGQKAVYNGQEPTKAPDANAVKYRFKGWDKDLNQPITQDTTFTAVFAEYAASQVVDNFESYTSNSAMADAWTVEAYKNNAWGETTASVSIGSKAREGSKSLRFNAWENGIGFRFLKHNEVGAFSKSANAIKFHMQIPSINTFKVIIKGKATISGQVQEPSFTYEIHPTTSEYVEYVIPLAASEWQLWQKAGDTIQTAADMIGVHIDDVVNYFTDVGFFVQGSDGGSNLPFFMFVDGIEFVTVDEPAQAKQTEVMGQYTRYTGLLNDGHTVKVELGTNGAATATIIDMETPQQIPGTVAIDADKNMTFTSADNGASLVYKAALKNGGQSMKFVQAGGTFAAAVQNVDLNAVQVVDNFEQYTEDGVAYYNSNKDVNNRKGCRGAYYSEYYSNNASDNAPWGGNKWSLLGGSGDQLKLKSDNGGHNGSKNYLCLKHTKGAAFRYMQWGLFDGTAEQNNFRGTTFSFWAKTKNHVNNFKVSLYSQSAPTNATQNSYVKYVQANPEAAIGEWTQYTAALDPKQTYYGYMVFMEKDGNLPENDPAYLYIDDVEVYTANPYAKYVAPVVQQQPQNGQVFCGKALGLAPVTIAIGKDNKARLGFEMMSVNEEVTYTINEDKISFDCGSLGSFVAQMNVEATELTYVSGTGTVADFAANVTFAKMDILDNAESYTESGKMYYQSNKDVNNRSGARGAYICDYYTNNASDSSPLGGSKWNLMGGSGDQLSLETSIVHSGANSLKLKRNYGATMRYATWGLMDGTAEGHTGASYFMYWVKNPNAKAATIKTSVYYQQTVTPSTQQSNRAYVEASIPANADWTPVVIPLDPAKTYYGVAYSVANPGGSGSDFLYVDDAMFFSEEMNVAAPFGVKEGLALSGTLQGDIAASMTFGKNNKVTLTCAALGGDVACTFTLIGNTLTIKVPALQQGGSGSTIVGTYGPVAMQNSVSFTVTSCTGDLATHIAADTVFQGSVA